MPTVPSNGQVLLFPERRAQPSPTDLAMAAAVMHEQGRLFEPEPKPELPPDAGEGEV